MATRFGTAGRLSFGGRAYWIKIRNLSRSYNFGPEIEDHLKVKKLVQIAIDCWESGEWLDISDKNQPHEAGILKLDINLARNGIKLATKLDSKLAVKWTIDWYGRRKVII